MNDAIFQQDGAPAHYSRDVRSFLNEKFPDGWIGRRGPVKWAPRSPDLTPVISSGATSRVESTQPNQGTSQLLKQESMTHVQTSPDMLSDIGEACYEKGGAHVEVRHRFKFCPRAFKLFRKKS